MDNFEDRDSHRRTFEVPKEKISLHCLVFFFAFLTATLCAAYLAFRLIDS
jgi:hypothetical protein